MYGPLLDFMFKIFYRSSRATLFYGVGKLSCVFSNSGSSYSAEWSESSIRVDPRAPRRKDADKALQGKEHHR